jgi:hypothetical protein
MQITQVVRLLSVVVCSFGHAEEEKAIDYQKRVQVEAKVTVKSKSANMSINDVRQDIGGYFLLKDDSSIYDSPIGDLKGKYWIIGQSVGGWSRGGTGKYVVFEREDWSANLPLKGTSQIFIQETSTVYDKMGSGKFGYEYYGYLFVAQDEADTYVLVKSNRKEFENAGPSFLKLEEKMTFDKDFEPKDWASWYR